MIDWGHLLPQELLQNCPGRNNSRFILDVCHERTERDRSFIWSLTETMMQSTYFDASIVRPAKQRGGQIPVFGIRRQAGCRRRRFHWNCLLTDQRIRLIPLISASFRSPKPHSAPFDTWHPTAGRRIGRPLKKSSQRSLISEPRLASSRVFTWIPVY